MFSSLVIPVFRRTSSVITLSFHLIPNGFLSHKVVCSVYFFLVIATVNGPYIHMYIHCNVESISDSYTGSRIRILMIFCSK